MTSVPFAGLYGATEQIKREAAQLDPVKVLITLLLVVPFVLGWAARFVWMVLALLWTGAVMGWRVASAQHAARAGADG